MKYFILSLTALVFTGCATAIPYSYEESCAMKGMKLKGVDQADSDGYAYNANVGSIYSSSTTTHLRCDVPQNDEEKARINHVQTVVRPKYEYNDGIGTKRFLTGAGYILYILPGIGLKLHYDDQRREAINKAEEIDRMPASEGLQKP
jgi:hypothetical protein